MVLAIASNKRRHLRPWEMNPWDARAREKSLEHIARQASRTNGHDATGMAYVLILPDISASSTIQNGMTAAELEAHKKDADKFNEWYANRGIEQVVENNHAGLFGKVAGKVYGAAAHGLSYFGNIAGKAVSLVPKPIKYATAPVLIALAAACTPTVQAKSVDLQVVQNARIEYNAVGDSTGSIQVFYSSISPIDRFDEVRIRIFDEKGADELYSRKFDLRDLKPNVIRTINFLVDVPERQRYKVVVETVNYVDTNDKNNVVNIEATPTAIPVLGNDYQQQLVQANYSKDIAQRVASLQDIKANRSFADELLLIGNKAGYARNSLVEKILPMLEKGNVSDSDLVVVTNLDGDQDPNAAEIAKGTNILDKFNRLPPTLESLAVLNDELYAVVAGNDNLVYAFTLQNFTSLFKELREAPYKDELMRRVTIADSKENVSQAWNYKVRREDGVLFSIIGLSPNDAEGWQFRWNKGKYHLDSRLAYLKAKAEGKDGLNTVHILPLDNAGIEEVFENKVDTEYAMMQLWVPDGMIVYDTTKWRQIAFLRDDGTLINYTDGQPSKEARDLAWQAMRNNMSVMLGENKINGLAFKDLRDRIVSVSRDHSIKSYPDSTAPILRDRSDYVNALDFWGRQDTTKHGGFNLVPESYGAIVVPILEQNLEHFELIKLAYGLGVLDMTGPESWDVLVNQIYQNALGYVAFDQKGGNPIDGGPHQYAAFVIPKKILQQLPSGILVYRGQSVSPYSMEGALISDGVKYVRQPNSAEIVWRLPASSK